MWDYCSLSNFDIDRGSEELDESDLMHLDIFDNLQGFYKNAIIDVFRHNIESINIVGARKTS